MVNINYDDDDLEMAITFVGSVSEADENIFAEVSLKEIAEKLAEEFSPTSLLSFIAYLDQEMSSWEFTMLAKGYFDSEAKLAPDKYKPN